MKSYKVTIRTRDDKAMAARALERCPWGYTVWFKPPVRTLAQNDRLWPCLEEIAAQKDWPLGSGIKRTEYFWKDIFTAALTAHEIVPGLEGGWVGVGKHTSEYSVAEMSDLLTLMEAWCAANGVTLKDKQDSPVTGETREEADMAEGPASSRKSSERAQ